MNPVNFISRPSQSAHEQATNSKDLPTAVVYCEGNLGQLDGKTANGLIYQCTAYHILSVIDSLQTGRDSGEWVNGQRNNIPVVRNLAAAVTLQSAVPQVLIYGMAPASGQLSVSDRTVIKAAIAEGMDIVCGLHEFLTDDAEFVALAKTHQVTLRDIRKPKRSHQLRTFDGSVGQTRALRIAILGTDCAIGKRTTSNLLTQALNAHAIKTILVTTGQTGLMQGGDYGLAMDAIPAQFSAGELEGCVNKAAQEQDPDVILIEGQGALSHPAFCTSALILRGCQPDAVILQHAPKRKMRCDFPNMKMPSLEDEIHLIETFSHTQVIGIAINHEGMSESELADTLTKVSNQFGLPVCDAMISSEADIAAMVLMAFPEKLSPTAITS